MCWRRERIVQIRREFVDKSKNKMYCTVPPFLPSVVFIVFEIVECCRLFCMRVPIVYVPRVSCFGGWQAFSFQLPRKQRTASNYKAKVPWLISSGVVQ